MSSSAEQTPYLHHCRYIEYLADAKNSLHETKQILLMKDDYHKKTGLGFYSVQDAVKDSILTIAYYRKHDRQREEPVTLSEGVEYSGESTAVDLFQNYRAALRPILQRSPRWQILEQGFGMPHYDLLDSILYRAALSHLSYFPYFVLAEIRLLFLLTSRAHSVPVDQGAWKKPLLQLLTELSEFNQLTEIVKVRRCAFGARESFDFESVELQEKDVLLMKDVVEVVRGMSMGHFGNLSGADLRVFPPMSSELHCGRAIWHLSSAPEPSKGKRQCPQSAEQGANQAFGDRTLAGKRVCMTKPALSPQMDTMMLC